MNVSELSGRVKIFSLVKDEDGSISRVPICLCELCRVNHFLCPRYASHSSAGEAVLESLKHHVMWLKETSRNQLFDAYAIGEMIQEAELRQQGERDR